MTGKSESHVENVVNFFQNLKRNDLGRLEAIYSKNAQFSDPFNKVAGIPAIVKIFEDMYERCDSARFVINERLVRDDVAYLQWEFSYRVKGKAEDTRSIDGVTRLVFDENGLVKEHRDYWDAARQIYERLPVIGRILRQLRKHLGSETTA